MNILLTGGAGFIGSHILEDLLDSRDVKHVVIIDNLSTGFMVNMEPFIEDERAQFINGNIQEIEILLKDINLKFDVVCHQAALGSVPRSIENPQSTFDNNVFGFIKVLEFARNNNIQKVVYASSSSVYGDNHDNEKIENRTGDVLSPYALSKLVNEEYAKIYNKTYGINFIGFRYFNVFGPRQNPNGAYAAVIPKFISSIKNDLEFTINGDGTISRDFTFVKNVTKANLEAFKYLSENSEHSICEILNVGCGSTYTLNELKDSLETISKKNIQFKYGEERQGDVKYSKANTEKLKEILGNMDFQDFISGLELTYKSYAD